MINILWLTYALDTKRRRIARAYHLMFTCIQIRCNNKLERLIKMLLKL